MLSNLTSSECLQMSGVTATDEM